MGASAYCFNMSLAEEIKNDWQEFDGVEDVTIMAYGGDAQAIRNCKALKRKLSFTDIALGAGLALTNNSRVWEVWRASMVGENDDFAGSYEIQSRDYLIQADGTSWTVASADVCTLDTRCRLICTRQIAKR